MSSAVELAARASTAQDADRIAFWEEAARRLERTTLWHTAHSWQPALPSGELDEDGIPALPVPKIEWFGDGTFNVAYNCVDRYVESGLGTKAALHFEGELGDRRTLTYAGAKSCVGS